MNVELYSVGNTCSKRYSVQIPGYHQFLVCVLGPVPTVVLYIRHTAILRYAKSRIVKDAGNSTRLADLYG